jgi:hypothetical protein
MMQRARWIGLFLLWFAFQACDGGGACAGCVEPIPGGFPLGRRIENSVQFRFTPAGITFLETHAGELVTSLMPTGLSFDIPESTSNITLVGDVTICPGGGCTATINLRGVDIQPTPPSSLVVVAQLEVITSNIRLSTERNGTCLWLSGFECDVDVDTRRSAPTYNTIRATLTFTIDTATGYTALDVTDAGLADDLQNEDIRIEAANTCGAIWCSIANIGFVKDYIIGTLEDQLMSTLDEQLAAISCMACPDSGCPTGSSCNPDGFCERSDGTCVPTLLGVEGQLDIGGMLASVSPGLSAQIQLLAAAGGYANVDGNGLNLGFYGGLEAPTTSPCIPGASTGDYSPVARSTEFTSGDSFTHCRRCPTGTECTSGYTCSAAGRCENDAGTCESVTEPVMLKAGIAEQFLNRALGGIYDAGALCLGMGTSAVPQLNSGMLGLLMPAISVLTWDETAPVAIEVRPQLPPRIEVGETLTLPDGSELPAGTLMVLHLDQAQMDFYLWMMERYVKILTVQMDLIVGLRLDAQDGAIVPAISALAADNVEVTDASIIGPPNNINDLFRDLLGLVSAMVPPFEPIALPEFSGFLIQVPDGGLTHVNSGGEDFLALHANLAVAPAPTPKPETFARVTSLEVSETARLRRGPARLAELIPTLTIDADARAPLATAKALDYRWRIDEGPWSPWTRDTRLVIRDAKLVFAGTHLVDVQSRVADDDRTIDPEPVRLEVRTDGLVPYVPVLRHDPSRAPSAGLRGRPDAGSSSSSGCECTVPASRARPLPLLLGLALGAVVVLRRRRRALLALLGVAALAASLLAAGCGDSNNPPADTGATCTADDQCPDGRCCPTDGQCVPLPAAEGFCPPGFGCLDGSGNFVPSWDAATCQYTTDCCAELPPLDEGFVGSHSEVAVAADGTVWVSAYSAGPGSRSPYGDLVVGTWDDAAGAVEWEHVDGVPTDATPTGTISGWRGGISDPGDDVGKYTALAVGTDGHPRVAYYDATNGALKYAAHGAAGWTVRAAAVDDTGDAGRWADLALGTDGRPVISYNALEERSDDPGAWVSKIKVARANDEAGTTWNVTEVESVDIPCWKELCGETRVCVAATRTCEVADPESACGADGCGSGEECVDGACAEVFETAIDFPEGVGVVTGIDFLPGGEPLVVYYDRGAWNRLSGELQPHGDLKQAVWSGSAWAVSVLDGSGTDAGWYPSVDVDGAGTRHVAYVDGIAEALIYLNPDAGLREVVDGRSLPGRARSIVGDDTSIRATAAGDVWIAYQDATARTLMLAHRAPAGGWATATYDTATDSAGFFATLVLAPDATTPVVSTYWHRTTTSGTTTTRYAYEVGVTVFEGAP